MLRAALTNIGVHLSQNINNISNNPVCVQCVRWRRKPRWLPVAKSKLFRVPERKKGPEEEYKELLRLHNIYRTQMKAIRAHFQKEADIIRSTTTAGHILISPEQEAIEYEQCLNENNAWNTEIAKMRNARLEKEAADKRAHILQRLELKELREEEHLEAIEKRVRLEKERAKTLIQRQDIEKAIEFALANPVDYNYSIDLKGNMFRGRNTLPDEQRALGEGVNKIKIGG